MDSLDVDISSEQFSDLSLNIGYSVIGYIILFVLFVALFIIMYKYVFNNDIHQNDNINNILTQNFINKNIISILEDNSDKNPDFPALNVKNDSSWISVSYEDYFNNVKQFALSLNNWLGEKCTVAIIGSNCPTWYYCHLGCIANNGVSVGIYSTSSSKTCEEIINDCDAKVVVVEDDEQLEKLVNINLKKVKLILYYSPVSVNLLKSFAEGSIPVVSFGVFMEKYSQTKKEKLNKKWNKIRASYIDNQAVTIIYTSGVTGKSKGVVLTHNNISSMIKMLFSTINNRFAISGLTFNFGERFVSYLPLNHIAAQTMDIYAPICLTGTVWFADKNALKGNNKSLITTIKDAKPTIFVGVPRIWEKFADQIKHISNNSSYGFFTNKLFNILSTISPKFAPKNKVLQELGLDECKYCISTGAPISDDTIEYFESFDVNIYNIYGLSETTGPITISLPNYKRHGSVGILLDGLRMKINMDGEILVKGNSISSTYYKNKNMTKKAFHKEWFKTGDIGYIDKGYLFITGRKKEIIISAGGENISPMLIENNIKKYLPDFEYALVVGNKKKYLTVLLFPKSDEKIYSKYESYNHLYGPNDIFKSEELINANANSNSNIDIDIINMKEIHNYVNNKINQVNKLAPNNSHKIQKWEIIIDKFNIGDELTPTHKIKRSFLYKKFNKEIEKLYED